MSNCQINSLRTYLFTAHALLGKQSLLADGGFKFGRSPSAAFNGRIPHRILKVGPFSRALFFMAGDP